MTLQNDIIAQMEQMQRIYMHIIPTSPFQVQHFNDTLQTFKKRDIHVWVTQRPSEDYPVHWTHIYDFLYNMSHLKLLLKTKSRKCRGSIPNRRPFILVPEFPQVLVSEDCQRQYTQAHKTRNILFCLLRFLTNESSGKVIISFLYHSWRVRKNCQHTKVKVQLSTIAPSSSSPSSTRECRSYSDISSHICVPWFSKIFVLKQKIASGNMCARLIIWTLLHSSRSFEKYVWGYIYVIQMCKFNSQRCRNFWWAEYLLWSAPPLPYHVFRNTVRLEILLETDQVTCQGPIQIFYPVSKCLNFQSFSR